MNQLNSRFSEGKVRTCSGIYFNPFDPSPDEINIKDIAQTLANLPLFGGRTEHFYSLAEYSVKVASMVSKELKLTALMSSASKAYFRLDETVKKMLPGYIEAESKFMAVTAEKLGFFWPLPTEVRQAIQLTDELTWHDLVLNEGKGATPGWAKNSFLTLYNELTTKQIFSDEKRNETT